MSEDFSRREILGVTGAVALGFVGAEAKGDEKKDDAKEKEAKEKLEAMEKLQKALQKPAFRKELAGSKKPEDVAGKENINPKRLPMGVMESLSKLSEDELTTIATVNGKVGKLASSNNGNLLF